MAKSALPKQVGARLRLIRSCLGQTQEAFGAQLGIDQFYVSKIELGKEMPHAELIERWVETMGLPLTFVYSAQPFEDIEVAEDLIPFLRHAIEQWRKENDKS